MRRKRAPFSDSLSILFLAAANPHTLVRRSDCDETEYSQRSQLMSYDYHDPLHLSSDAEASGFIRSMTDGT